MKYISLVLMLLLLSCSLRSDKLEYALRMADYNRFELEKVLQHYKNDSLKTKAAIFLIENMPYYSYQSSSEIDSIKVLMSDIFNKKNITEKERQKGIYWKKNIQSVIKYDIREITAEMLIDNIDLSFEVWRKKTWNKNLSFEDFCELILPYRIAEEPLTFWRKKYYEKYNPILDSLYNGTDVVEACNRLSDYMKNEGFYYFTDFGTPRQGAKFQLNNRIGTCRDACDIATYVMRSVGIPVTADMFPYSPEYKIDHEWNVVRDTTGRYLPFWYEQFNAVRNKNFTDKRKKGKVFRLCYGLQKNIEELSSLPKKLRNPFLKDVTEEYFGKNKVNIPFKSEYENVFLGIFTARDGWYPVGKGKVLDDGHLIFKNLEPFVIYQPLAYENNTLKPIYYPFMLKNNGVHIFSPKGSDFQEVELTRKYSFRKNSTGRYKKWLKNTQIKGSNDKKIKSYDVLHKMKELPPENVINIEVNTEKKYKYFQYEVPKDSVLAIAEIHFFNKKNKKIIFDTIYSDGKPWRNTDIYQLKNCHDDNPISFFYTSELGKSIFFKTKTPQRIKRIQLIPRNDDNFIREGDVYELFYNNGNKGWISLGKRQATNNPILYYKAPKNAVLWLKNEARGIEEQIFTYEGGKQIFPTFEQYGK